MVFQVMLQRGCIRIIVLLSFLVNQVVGGSKTLAMEKPAGPIIACSTALQSTLWRANGPVPVSLAIRNAGLDHFRMGVVAGFLLVPVPDRGSEWVYNSFWNGKTDKGLSLPRRFTLELAAGAVVKKTVNVADLFWTRRNASLLPFQKLFKVVPAGRYRFSFVISDPSGTVVCRSGIEEVQIEEGVN